jgi:hypothetical protein
VTDEEWYAAYCMLFGPAQIHEAGTSDEIAFLRRMDAELRERKPAGGNAVYVLRHMYRKTHESAQSREGHTTKSFINTICKEIRRE